MVQLQRGSDRITPDGNTLLYANDRLILSAKSSGNVPGISLTELPLDKAHEWVGQSVSSLPLEAGKLVVMIRRGDETIIPNGQTVLECNDTLVINQCD